MYFFDKLGGESSAMRKVYELIEQIAGIDLSILITGESGTGKDLVAQSIHKRSPRANGPFVAVNTGAIAKELIASELFGHERGAFTGAADRQRGKFELAGGGTLFLDEVSTMDVNTQVSLLRVLESRQFQRVGGEKYIRCDTRVIAASNEDLRRAVKEGHFREDLFHRLNVFRIELPPLRERDDDVVLLADYFLERYGTEFNRPVDGFEGEAMELLRAYSWPGNVRELENAVMRAAITAQSEKIRPEDLPDIIRKEAGPTKVVLRVGSSLDDAERALIAETVKRVGGNKSEAAKILGISRKALYNKLKEYDLEL